MGEPLPDVPVPHWPTTVNFYPGYGANTPDTQVYQKTFLGYYYNDPSQGEVQYYDENGKGLLNLPYAIDRGLSSSWGTPVINLPAATRKGYSFAGWYTASEGGELAGMAGAEYDLTATESLNLYARWKELTFSWNFNPVTARGNSADSVVRGLWSGFVDGREVLCAACNGYLWELERQEKRQAKERAEQRRPGGRASTGKRERRDGGQNKNGKNGGHFAAGKRDGSSGRPGRERKEHSRPPKRGHR